MLIVVVSLIACSSLPNFPAATRTVAPGIPKYPGAESSDTQVTTGIQGSPMQVVTFLTKDTPDDVLSFYRKQLEQEGWTFENRDDPYSLGMSNEQACPYYGMYIQASPTDETSTTVKIQMSEIPCLAQ